MGSDIAEIRNHEGTKALRKMQLCVIVSLWFKKDFKGTTKALSDEAYKNLYVVSLWFNRHEELTI